jgi:hypothetical protein
MSVAHLSVWDVRSSRAIVTSGADLDVAWLFLALLSYPGRNIAPGLAAVAAELRIAVDFRSMGKHDFTADRRNGNPFYVRAGW